jgi:hypothetical protein
LVMMPFALFPTFISWMHNSQKSLVFSKLHSALS